MSFDIEGMRVFLSGPMTGKPEHNRKAFMEAETWCELHGAWGVYNPARNIPKADEPDGTHEQYMLVTLNELTRYANRAHTCADARPFYDALILLDGWWASKGANAERMVAQACGIEVIELKDAMDWAKEDEW